ncbi:MAG TPA: 3-hydroxyacyl-CoA dehydrogenase NAD-binding domain-containing protein [Nonomuraea sp.]|nr:3-hydroxyacyl-CoA dehydrogenase NAD-binding domain-containing protein [Nonomuraea sp.]
MALIGVVGMGVMGVGVAQNLAQAGHRVVVTDLSAEILEKGRGLVERNSRMSQMLGGLRLDVPAIMNAITLSTDLAELAAAEIVVENITENFELKREVYRRLDEICAPETVFVANTSAIPITKLAGVTRRPAQVVGVHFMNPVPLKPVVELIPGYHTSAETLDRVRTLLKEMGKQPIQVKDACGFVSNRVLMLTVNEAAYLVYEGTATADQVDEVFRGCFGHPMGPLETADLIGVDTILYSIQMLYENFADSKYRPCPLLAQMTDAGLHGRKSGRGFYTYDRLTAEA